jgi:hypothetical protein
MYNPASPILKPECTGSKNSVLWKLKIVHRVSQRAVRLNNADLVSGERKSHKSEDDECGSGLGSSVSYKNNVRKQLDFDTFTGLFLD